MISTIATTHFDISGSVNDAPIDYIAYYPFNGNANDESGNGNNGIVNDATLTTDRFGNADSAYSFNGNLDASPPVSNIVLPGGILDLTGATFTFCAWIYPTAYGSHNSKGLVDKFHMTTGSFSRGARLHMDNTSGRLVMVVGSGDGDQSVSQQRFSSSFYPSLNEWSFVACSFDGITLTIWHNKNSESRAYTLADPIFNPSLNFRVGRTHHSNGGFKGKIDDVRIFDRALTSDEVEEMYLSPIKRGTIGAWVKIRRETTSTTMSYLSSIPYTYRIGSSNTNYYQWDIERKSAWRDNEWQYLPMPLTTITTTVGTVDNANINYRYFAINTSPGSAITSLDYILRLNGSSASDKIGPNYIGDRRTFVTTINLYTNI